MIKLIIVLQSDRWWPIRSMVNEYNQRRIEMVSPGEKLVVDESMSYWLGQEGLYSAEGMVHVTKMKSKPRGVGLMLKSCADGQSGLMVRLEMQEAKESMNLKEFQLRKGDVAAQPDNDQYQMLLANQQVYAYNTAVTLRLVKPWFGSNRTVIGDSAFSSIDTLLALKNRGLHFMGCIKTAHKGFCKGFLNHWGRVGQQPALARGSHMSATSRYTVNGTEHKMLAVGWSDKKVKCLLSSRSTTLAGEPSKRKRHYLEMEDGRLTTKRRVISINRPKVVEEYFEFFAAIDIHDHYRQGSLAIEDNWPRPGGCECFPRCLAWW